MKLLTQALFLSLVVVPLTGNTMEDINDKEMTQMPEELQEIELKELNLTEEETSKKLETYGEAGFTDRWNYFWKSDDELEIKKEKMKSFYEDTKDYWRKAEKEDELYSWIGLTINFLLDQAGIHSQNKMVYKFMKGMPEISEYVESTMSRRILNMSDNTFEGRVQQIANVAMELFTNDLKQLKKK